MAARRRLETLSERELEVLRLLGEGLSNAGLGARLNMSEATVKTYVSRVLAKLDCDNRVQTALLDRDASLDAAGAVAAEGAVHVAGLLRCQEGLVGTPGTLRRSTPNADYVARDRGGQEP